ncbi:PaaI family thioesterase [Parasulfitobacter algicola]|uniref:PaaI family thioesterase n=1 Tax=Parasulfitobacter algicola TaxID=2614809 RepID=A0ABX2INJ7_9RHOB|nr:PaaI family thioesterase [Sulfitobacter algicola]NSX54438.1 PaaI family thioesterase [Sulfitobacter algicola]
MIDKPEFAKVFMEAVPHNNALGMKLISVGDGVVETEMPYDERFIGDPKTGVIHGGVVYALMDASSGTAVIAHKSNPVSTATIDLRIDYMRSATPGQTIRARAECYHVTRTVAFIRATATDDDRDNPVATATGTFTVEHAE